MTWDVYAIRAPRGAQRVEDIPDSYVPRTLGYAESVIETIREAAPHVDASDPTWLRLDGPDHSIEVALGKATQIHDLTFYIRGGDGAVPLVLEVCRRLRVTPYDTESGEVLTAASTRPQPPPDEPKRAAGGIRRWLRRHGE